jgi:hypothetical protein
VTTHWTAAANRGSLNAGQKKGDAEMSNKDQSKKKEKTNKPKLTVKEKQDKKKAKKKGE